MAEWVRLLVYALRSRFKTRGRLEAGNPVLRQQINALSRSVPARTADESGATSFGLAVAAFTLDRERDENHQTRNRGPLARVSVYEDSAS
jgi:hypothetical protein